MTVPTAPIPDPAAAPVLADRFGRAKRKLRISLTDRCNLRCLYCMPEHPDWLPKRDILRREELVRLARLFVTELGIRELRLTGGEPLLRRDLVDIVSELDALRPLGLERIALTSNGIYLPRLAGALREAGLDDINVSLDARTPETFERLTGGHVDAVLAGIDAAREAGLPVKVNAVVIRDYNEHELLPLLAWAQQQGLPLRLIEFMPLDGRGAWSSARVVGEAEMLATLRSEHHIEALPETDEPARYYRVDGDFRLGIISTITRPFCTRCDRIRLSSVGGLYACLFSANGRDLRSPLRDGCSDDELIERIRTEVWNKDAGYASHGGYVERPIVMHHLGG